MVGRQCNACVSRFGEVTSRGCEVQYDKCPRNLAGGLWWDRVEIGVTAWKQCPGSGTEGRASRICRSDGWSDPDLFNCTSAAFVELRTKLDQLSSDDLVFTTFVAKEVASELERATNVTWPLFGSDLLIANELLVRLLQFENSQAGLNLTHAQNRNFIQVPTPKKHMIVHVLRRNLLIVFVFYLHRTWCRRSAA